MTVNNPIKKIDFIIVALSGGGAERVLTILANNFADRGYEVSVLTFNESSQGDDAYVLDPKIERIKLHDGKYSNHKIRSLNSLVSYYKDKTKRPDVIISFVCFTNLIAILAARFYGIKIIASEHTNHHLKGSPEFLVDFTRKYIYRMANFITVLTSYDLPYYKDKGSKVVVMPNPTTFSPIENNNHKREKIILAVGRLNNYHIKGFDNLLSIMPPILEKFPEWKLKIIGDGQKGENFLKASAKKLNIEDRVIFTGFQNNIAEHMQNASIFVLSSRSEGLPMVLLEAMSQGMVCIAYDCITGPSDIINDGENGVLVENQNMEEMTNGLTKLVENETLRFELAENAIQSLDKFSMETISSKWEQLFKNL